MIALSFFFVPYLISCVIFFRWYYSTDYRKTNDNRHYIAARYEERYFLVKYTVNSIPKIHAKDKNNELQHFLAFCFQKVSDVKKHLVSKLYTVNISLLKSTCISSRKQDLILHQQMPNGDKTKLS